MAKYRLKDGGFVFIDKNGRAQHGVKIVDDSNPAFKNQRWKFHPEPVQMPTTPIAGAGGKFPKVTGDGDDKTDVDASRDGVDDEPTITPDQLPIDEITSKDVKVERLVELAYNVSGRRPPDNAPKSALKKWLVSVHDGLAPDDADAEFFGDDSTTDAAGKKVKTGSDGK